MSKEGVQCTSMESISQELSQMLAQVGVQCPSSAKKVVHGCSASGNALQCMVATKHIIYNSDQVMSLVTMTNGTLKRDMGAWV